MTVAYDPATGQRSWVQRHDSQAKNEDYAWAVRATPDGTKVIIAGQSTDAQALGTDYVTIAYDAASS